MNDQKGSQKTQLTRLMQVGVVVKDIEKTREMLSATFGIGPWVLFEWPTDGEKMKGRYRGQPGNFRFIMAFAQMGHVELELIQPLEGESIYSEFLEQKGEGLHHILFHLTSVQEALASWQPDGIEAIQSGTGLRPGTEWAYLNTAELPGFGGITFEVITKGYEGDEPPPRG